MSPPRTSRSVRPAGARTAVQPDRVLVELARTGDERAQAVLFTRHEGVVRATVRCRVSDHAAVAGITQETFIRAFANLDRLRNPDGFRPWLLQIARHRATDHHRRRRPEFAVDWSTLDGPVTVADPAHDNLVGEDTRRELLEMLDQLPPKDPAALRHLPTDGAPDYRRLAVALDTTQGNARSIIHRARRRLRDLLAARWELEAHLMQSPHNEEQRRDQ